MLRAARGVAASACRLPLLMLSLAAAPAAIAQSNSPFQCAATAAVPPIIRAEGVTELVGDLVLNCTGGAPSQFGATVPQVNVQVYLNTNITSRLIADPLSEATLLIDEPTGPSQRLCSTNPCVIPGTGTPGGVNYRTTPTPNTFPGRQTGPNSLTFLGVPIDPPGPNSTRVIRITNVRANATQLGISQTLALSTVLMFVSISGSTALPISNPAQTVAYVQPGVNFRVLGLDSSANPVAVPAATGVPYAPCATSAQMVLRFEERFPSAFKIRGTPPPGLMYDTESSPTPVRQDSPGVDSFTESGLYNPTLTGRANAGLADSGTRLMARFSNLPDGAVLVAELYERNRYPSRARMVAVDQNGAGAFTPAGSDLASAVASGGTATFVWEVLQADPFQLETIDFNVTIYYSPAGKLSTSLVTGGFAPLATTGLASATAAIPRFGPGYPQNAFTTSACSFNLLFPYVTNSASFDTAMVISNTNYDPFVSPSNQGTCTLYYYGNNAPPPQTSQPIPPGASLAWTLGSGGNFGVTATPGFQGYVIARCGFPYLHGFASIGPAGNPSRVAYLPIILDMPSMTYQRTQTMGENQAH